MTNLAVIEQPAAARLSEASKKIRNNFISHLATLYVVDESGNYPRAIKGSGRSQNMSSLPLEFSAWAKANDYRIPTTEYAKFMSGLEQDIRRKLPRVCGISLKPVAERSFFDSKGDRLLNTYIPYAPDFPKNYDQAKLILDAYFDRLFHQNVQDKKVVREFLAHTVQCPTERPQWALMIRGASACGKSSLIELLKIAFGGRYVYSPNTYALIKAKFGEELPNNMMICFDDATASRDTSEDLKLTITRATVQVEIKGVQTTVERDVYTRIAILSNHHRPLILREDCRRFYVTEYLTHLHSEEESGKYYETFLEFWKDKNNAAAIYWYFMKQDIADFKPNVRIKTEARKQLVCMSTSVLDGAIAEFLGGMEVSWLDENDKTQYSTPPVQTIFHENQLIGFLIDKGIKDIPSDQIARKLTEAGYSTARRVVKDCNEGKQIDLWQRIMDGKKKASALTDVQIIAISQFYNRHF